MFQWIVFPIESAVLTLETGAHRTPSKRFTPWTRPIVVSNMCILFCCILSFCFIPYREYKDSDLIRYFQRFYTLIFSQLGYILKYILSGVLGNDYGLHLFVQLRASAFVVVFNHLVYFWIGRDNLVRKCLFKSSSSSISHQTSVLEVHTSIQIQLCPMAFRTTRWKALNQSTIG